MNLISMIAGIAARMPRTVYKARYFRKFHKLPPLPRDVMRMTDLYQYVVWNGLANRNNPAWGVLADKYAVRDEVGRLIGSEHLIGLLGHWENPDDIDFDSLPDTFILKTNNGCATNIFVHDKSKIDRSAIIDRMKRALAFPYPQLTGQPHYSLIPPCVVAEEILVQDGGHKSLTDYKIHCVNGEPQTLYIFDDRDEVNHFDFTMRAYTPEWRELPPGMTPDQVAANPEAPDRPAWLDEMLDIARKLSAGHEYVRVDLYRTNGRIYFGEMTFTPDTRINKCYADYQPAMAYVLEKIKQGRRK